MLDPHTKRLPYDDLILIRDYVYENIESKCPSQIDEYINSLSNQELFGLWLKAHNIVTLWHCEIVDIVQLIFSLKPTEDA